MAETVEQTIEKLRHNYPGEILETRQVGLDEVFVTVPATYIVAFCKFLIEQGWMGTADKRLSKQALEDMRAHELRTTAKILSSEVGMPVTLGSGTVSGVYTRRIDLAQGRVALIVGDQTSQLVPWRPALERFAGQNVVGVQRGRSISWSLQRGRGLGLGI